MTLSFWFNAINFSKNIQFKMQNYIPGLTLKFNLANQSTQAQSSSSKSLDVNA